MGEGRGGGGGGGEGEDKLPSISPPSAFIG